MGQKRALIYKFTILTKRQKAGFCCQVVSPLFGIALIALILSNKDSFTPDLPGLFGSKVLPGSLYFSNLITPKWTIVWENLFEIENPIRINRYAAADDSIAEKFENWVDAQTSTLTFDGEDDDGNLVTYPQWIRSEKSTIEDLNEQLIKEVKILNSLDKNELKTSEDLPDSSMLIKSIEDEKGIDAHFQTNNIAYDQYHRMNGQTFAKQLATGGGAEESSNVYPTESGVAQMNMISNMHIQSIFENDFINIVSLVSTTVDASTIDELIQSALAIVCNMMFPVSLCLGFPIMLFVLVMEKEEKIRSLLEINGLKNVNYWVTFFIYYFIILEVTLLIWLIIGKMSIDIDFFQGNSFLIHIWIFTVWNLAQIGFSLFFSSFLSNSRSATLVGYQGSIFLILFLCIVSQFLFPNPGHMPIFFYFLPQTAMVRYIYLVISKCIDIKCYTSISDIKGEMLTVFIALHLTTVVYTVVGLILNEPIVAKKLRLMKLMRKLKRKKKNEEVVEEDIIGDEYKKIKDEDWEEKHETAIIYEQKISQVRDADPEYILLTKDLSKTFPCSQGIKKALTNFSIGLKKDQIFGLLGPNGAGKTTFLNIATGIVDQDEGKGWICGNNIEDTGSHSGNIGFCPQFDILWPLLNVEEHLMFMGMFKGVSKKDMKESVKELIKDVDLEEDFKKLAKELSGGMKRRCSLAMALTGNPKVIFLDEPSSGLDPVKRRHFWQLIQRVTKERAVLLTTHLMEEADTLCDEIGIVTTGKLRCVGNSVKLKSSFTEGIKLQIVMDESNRKSDKVDKFMEDLHTKIPGIELEGNFRGTLSLVVKDKAINLSYLFEIITQMATERISDWSISLGSLEDVFLTVVKRYRETNIFAVDYE